MALGGRTLVMGILNVTPDSFSDGGRYLDPSRAVERALQMQEEGADLIDVGGESTRPGSDEVDAGEEWRRLKDVLPRLSASLQVPVSVDTRKSSVAGQALEAGAEIVNDVSMLRYDPRLAQTAARYGAGLILMHSRGYPKTMQDSPAYGDLWAEILSELSAAAALAESAGVAGGKIVVDPGLGFSKSFDDNLKILRELSRLHALGRPALVGASRKSFLGRILDQPATGRGVGGAVCVAACALAGVSIVRVHDVKEAVEAARVADAIRGAGNPVERPQGP